MWEIIFYISPTGRCPMKEFLDGLYELRPNVNKRQIRCLYFFFHRDKIIFSHGFIKKGNTKLGDAVDPKEINRAVENRKEYIRKNEK